MRSSLNTDVEFMGHTMHYHGIETRTHREENLCMESNMQYLQTKVLGYWGKINILLMLNRDQLGQK